MKNLLSKIWTKFKIPLSIFTATAVATSSLYLYNKNKDISKNLNLIPTYNQTYKIQLQTPEIANVGEKKIKIKAGITKNNEIFYGIYTENYAGKLDPEKTTLDKRLEKNINGAATKIFVLHPNKISIGKTDQRSYQVPPNQWEDLIPYEEHENARITYKLGTQIINKLLSKIGISEKNFNQVVEWYAKKENKNYEDALRKINSDFNITKIPNYLPKRLLGYIETAREGVIPITSTHTPTKLYLVLDPFIGNASRIYGKLEKLVIIPFTIKDAKLDELLKYFPDVGWKDSNVELIPKEKTARDNPIILSGNQTTIKGDIKAAFATYKIEPSNKGNETLRIEVYEFDSQKSLEKNYYRFIDDDWQKGKSNYELINTQKKIAIAFYLKPSKINFNKKIFLLKLIKDYPKENGIDLATHSVSRGTTNATQCTKQELDSELERLLENY